MRMTQDQFMRLFNEKHREQFNPIFFQRSNREIMDCMKKVILSCERDRYFSLSILEMREIYDYEEIINTLREYEERKRKKNSKEENPYDYINIKDSDLMLLEVRYLIRHNGPEIQDIKGPDGKKHSEVVLNPWDILSVVIALPMFSKKYYLRLNGNYYSDTFQIVDGSTYNNVIPGQKNKKAACNSFKTMFSPVRIFRMFRNMTDYMSQQTVKHTLYTSIIPLVYNTHANCMYYILANYGFYNALKFLDIDCITLGTEPIIDDRFYNFEKNGIFIRYPKECEKDPMVQSLAATLYDGILAHTTYEDMFDIRHWLTILGKCFGNETIDKGLSILDSLDGVYDIITREQLHLEDEYKADIYLILRWLMREFNYIRDKNNVDVTLKRYRIGEPIAAIYANKLIMGLLRVADMGKKVTVMSVIRAINIHPMYIINHIIAKNNLIAYRDMVNDNDATVALKWTFKGISGLGENGTNIQMIYRYVDPSHAGILDLDSSTTSDPGMTGTLCPLGKIYEGNSFSEYKEPNFWEQESRPIQTNFYKENYREPTDGFEGHPEDDMTEERKKVIKESMQIDIPVCPFESTIGEDLTIFAAELRRRKEEEAAKIGSLFTIMDDQEEEE